MAKGRIQGITIELDGETKGLQAALKDVNSQSKSVSSELKDVERLLKFNPGNTEAIAQKQKLLGDQVALTSEKLNILKGSQADVEAQFQRGDIGEEQYRAFKREIEFTEGALNGFKGQLGNVQTEQDRLGQNTSRLDTLFQATGSTVEDYQDILGTKLTNSIKNGTASADDMEVALNKIGKAALGGEVDLKDMKTTLDQVDDGNSIDNIQRELKDLSVEADNSGESFDNLGSKINAGNMMEAAEIVAGVGEKLKDFASDAQEAFYEVDDGMDLIVTKTGVTGDAVQGFENIYRNLIGSLPIDDFEKIGEAVGELNTQFGFTDKQLQSTSEYMLKFSEINDASVTDSAISAKQAIEAYGLSNEDLTYVLDSVTKTAQDTGQSVDKLFDSSVKGAPQIKALGLNFAEGTTLLGQFEKSGVDSSKALSYLSKASVTYAKDGKSLSTGLEETSNKIKGAKDDTEALAIASEVFGNKGASVMADAIRRGAINLDDLSSSSENANGVVGQTFDDTLDPIDQQQVALNNVKLAMADIGNTIAETVEPILTAILPVIKTISDAFTNLPGPVKTFIVVLGGIAIVVAAVLPVIAAFAAAAGVAGLSIGAFMLSLLPIIAIIAAVIAVVALVIAVITNWGAITDWLKAKWDEFSKFIIILWGLIKLGAMAIWNSIAEFFVGLWNGIVDIAKNVWNGLGEFFSGLWTGIKETASSIWNGLIDFLVGLWNGVIDTGKGIWNGLGEFLGGLWDGIKSKTASAWKGIKDAIMNPINDAKDAVKKAIDAMKDFFNFNWKLPSIKMPHFSVSGSANPIDWIKKGVPKINVDWFAKGGILTKPTAFGMNGNSIMAGGEAGKEAVAPISTLMSYVRQAVAEANGSSQEQMVELLRTLVEKNMNVYLNEDQLVGFILDTVDRKLANKGNDTGVGSGRAVAR
ncbi:MAG: phage tail tape measure protein [Vagococcus sp.]|uniref:phage tail tape measure protein n=1 Tax=Vagococcus sp. TaxID=1933889 RepID=UPI002FCBD8CD